MPFSTPRVRPIAPSRRSTAGPKCSRSSTSISPRRPRHAPPSDLEEIIMCSYIVEKAKLLGSAKGPNGWMRIDTANVYYDHPFHAPLDHALGIDFINEAAGGGGRVAGGVSAGAGTGAGEKILAALANGEVEHGKAAHHAAPAVAAE